MNLGSKLSDFWRRFQGELFPALAEEVGPLLGTHRRFVAALDLVGVEGFLGEKGYGPGRPPQDRRALARAFLAKALWDLSTNRNLLTQIKPTQRRKTVSTTVLQEPLLANDTARGMLGFLGRSSVVAGAAGVPGDRDAAPGRSWGVFGFGPVAGGSAVLGCLPPGLVLRQG